MGGEGRCLRPSVRVGAARRSGVAGRLGGARPLPHRHGGGPAPRSLLAGAIAGILVGDTQQEVPAVLRVMTLEPARVEMAEREREGARMRLVYAARQDRRAA